MQPTNNGAGTAGDAPKMKTNVWGKAIGVGLLVIVAFGTGMAVGDGRITFGSNSTGSTLPGKLNYASVDEVYNVLRKQYDGKLDETKLLDGIKQGMAEATGDPYTQYFTTADYKKFNEQLNGVGFSGIGAELGLDKDKNLIVVSPISGMPASKAGLKAQDIIAEIDGKTTTGLSIEDGVSKIRGKKGTVVKLKIVRNRAETLDLDITRDDIKVPTVESKVLDDGTTGYIHISTFGEDTGEKTAEQAKDLKSKGIKSLVLDLRGNPGGVVDSAIQIASLWLPQGKLVMQEKRDATIVKTYTADGNNILSGIPTVVLIDKGSASASEIVAGALHDNKVAKLVGEQSYGKGVVQGIEPLEDGSQLKVTVARWYRPNGQNIDKKGIEPDQKVTINEEDLKAGKDTQLDAARAAL